MSEQTLDGGTFKTGLELSKKAPSLLCLQAPKWNHLAVYRSLSADEKTELHSKLLPAKGEKFQVLEKVCKASDLKSGNSIWDQLPRLRGNNALFTLCSRLALAHEVEIVNYGNFSPALPSLLTCVSEGGEKWLWLLVALQGKPAFSHSGKGLIDCGCVSGCGFPVCHSQTWFLPKKLKNKGFLTSSAKWL